jgi:hypothetical protein
MGDARRVFFASESRRRDAIYQDLRARMLQSARHVHLRQTFSATFDTLFVLEKIFLRFDM